MPCSVLDLDKAASFGAGRAIAYKVDIWLFRTAVHRAAQAGNVPVILPVRAINATCPSIAETLRRKLLAKSWLVAEAVRATA